MKQFLYRIYPTRMGMLSDSPSQQEAKVIGEHFLYLEDLTNRGIVLLAGRSLTDEMATIDSDNAFGIVILETGTQQQAARIMENDPAVKANVMSARLFPFNVALWSQQGPEG